MTRPTKIKECPKCGTWNNVLRRNICRKCNGRVRGSAASICFVGESDKAFLWSLMPEWVRSCPKGLDPTMYGTGSREQDMRIRDRVVTILGENPTGQERKASSDPNCSK